MTRLLETKKIFVVLWLLVGISSLANICFADPTVSDPWIFTSNLGAKPNGTPPMYLLDMGATVSDPLGVPDNISSVTASGLNGQPGFTLTYQPCGVLGVWYGASPHYYGWTGSWRVTATNLQGQTHSIDTPFLSDPRQIPLTSNIQFSDSSTTPTVTWNRVYYDHDLNPSTPDVEVGGYQLRLMTPVCNYIYSSGWFQDPVHTIPGGVLQTGQEVWVRINAKGLETQAGGSYNNRSSTFATFTGISTPHAAAGCQIETVASGYYPKPSLAIGPDGSVHIAAAPTWLFNTPLVYAHRVLGAWSVELRGYARNPGLGVDSLGNIHLAYEPNDYPGEKGDGVHHAMKAAGVWSDVKVESNTYWPALTIDRGDIVHLAYRDAGTYVSEHTDQVNLRYASRISGPWTASTAATELLFYDDEAEIDEELGQPSVTVDSTGRGYIAYVRTRETSGSGYCELKLAAQTSGGWVSTVIDTMGLDTVAWDNNVDIAIDGNDRLHIVYFDDSNYFSDGPYVKYATNTSGVWTTSILLRNAWYPAIAIDKSNKIHIVYNTQDTLNYINNVSGNWIDSTITTVFGDTLSDIAVDGARRIHVSYYSEGEGLLKYATCAAKGKAMPWIPVLLGD